MHDIVNLRNGTLGRIPDIIVWPKNEDEVMTVKDSSNLECCRGEGKKIPKVESDVFVNVMVKFSRNTSKYISI